jgi:hypothetical protein
MLVHSVSIGAAAKEDWMMNRAWRIRGYGIRLGAASLLLVASALAVDGNVYNGSECTFTEPGQYNGQDRSYFKLWNSSGSTQTISCPLTRDNVTGNVTYVYVISSDDINSGSCRFWEVEDDFSYQNWTYDSVTQVTPDYDKTRWFNGTTQTTTDNSSYQITCDMPTGAGIYTYYLEET